MTRALVSGYYGFGNAGDEAILAGLVEGFRAGAPEMELTVLSGNPTATQTEHGVQAMPRGLSEARALLPEYDLLISGGGGLLQDATSWRSPLYYLGLLALARHRRKPAVCIGHSIGPLSRGWVRLLTRRVLAGVKVLAVRDRRSAEALQALGVRREVRVTADLAFLLPAPGTREIEAAWRKAGLATGSSPVAAICARRLPQSDEGRGAAIAEAAVVACRAQGLRPVLVPMQRPQDTSLAEEVAARAQVADVVRAPLTARDMLALLCGFDLVIAMRLHALIMAALGGRPLVAISYDPKVDGLMAELELPPAASAEAFAPDRLAAAVAQAWEDREQLSRHLAARAQHLRAAARENIDLVRQVVTSP